MKRFLIFFIFITLLISCGDDDNGNTDGPCKGVTCSDHGTCDDSSGYAVCQCDEGYVQDGLEACVPYEDPCEGVNCEDWQQCVQGSCRAKDGYCGTDSDCTGGATCNTTNHTCEGGTGNPCDGVTCSGHGTCVSDGYGYNATAHCDCEDGYTAQGLECISEANPCDGVTCSGHGTCFENSGTPMCNCDDGYVVNGLQCIEEDPCANVNCEEWQECNGGTCEVKDGRCETDTHCTGADVCDSSSHNCISDPCDGVDCGTGVCSIDNGSATCNCLNGEYYNGTTCVSDSSFPANTWCSVQWPYEITGEVGGASEVVYAQIYIPGVTETQSESSSMIAQLGVGTTIENPVIATDMVWVDASFNTSCTTCGNNHEYMADFPMNQGGDFKYIYRFSNNNGQSWIYCDTNGYGGADSLPFSPADAGVATISGGQDPCGGEYCDSWEECINDSCEVLAGRCNTTADCNAGVCNTSTHECEGGGGEPVLTLTAQPQVTSNGYSFTVQYSGDSALDFSTSRITLNGESVDLEGDYSDGTFTISESGVDEGKYTYLFRVKDENGMSAKTLYVPVWVESEPFEWKDAFLYQIMTDRFLDGNDSNNAPVDGVDFERNWQGGDYRGIIQKIESGYFADMGVNALWISSPVVNTDGKGKGVSDGQWYSGYHSYWPVGTGWTDTNHLDGMDSPLEPHFGSEADFRELIRVAHENKIRVLADFVANHIFGITDPSLASGSTSPLWENTSNRSTWFHSGDNPYVCGWDQPIVCWFTTYLPDFNYSNPAVIDAVMDHAIWLIQEYDLDGFRLDAVKHMIMDFTTTIRTRTLNEVVTTGIPFYMVGETFDGDSNYLNSFVGADKLDGQFEFGFYFTIRDAILHDGDINNLKDFLAWNDTFYTDRWSGALMSNFIGNHDVRRALNEAGGGHYKVRLAQTVLMTSPRIPLIYQGDEFGMPGEGDPDNRRMMRFSGLSSEEQATIDHLKKLGVMRSQNIAARRGSRSTCGSSNNYWIYTMTHGDNQVVVGINKGGSDETANCSGVSGTYTDLNGNSVSLSGNVTVPAGGSVVYYK